MTESLKCIIVVARYKENLNWINYDLFKNYKLIIYNKGSDLNFTQNENILEIIDLPNIGRESHTYLYHILFNHKRYNPNITIFCTGSLDNKYKYNDAKIIIKFIEQNNYTKSVFTGNYLSKKNLTFILKIENFPNKYISTNEENKKNNITDIVYPVKEKRLINWLINKNLKCINFTTYNGTISVHRNIINNHDVQYYENLISELIPKNKNDLIKYSNHKAGFYFERSWSTIFYSKNDCIFYDWKLKKIVTKDIIYTDCSKIFTNK